MQQLPSNPVPGLTAELRTLAYFIVDDESEVFRADMERAFVDFCAANLHQPVETFAADAVGGKPPDAEFQRMLEYMRQSGSEFLVAAPSARHFGEDIEAVARSIIALDRVGAGVTCFDEDFPNPLQNAFQTLDIKGVSRARSRRISESMRVRASRGQPLGRPPYGYRIGSDRDLQVVRHEASVVELIYRLYTRDELGFRLIAQHLNERGIRTRRGGNWNVVSIRDILSNSAYTGTYTRFGMRRPRVHEPIIPSEVFRAAQDQIRSRRPVGRVMNPQPFLLSGLAYCRYCGNTMIGVTRRQSWKRKDGRRARGVYRYYQCQSKINQSQCGYHTWRESLLEGAVLAQLGLALRVRDSLPPGERERALGAEHADEMRKSKARKAERRFVRAMKRTARGEMSLKVLGEYLDELDSARRAAETAVSPADISEGLAKWDSLDLEERRTILTESVVRVVVEDDKVEVVV